MVGRTRGGPESVTLTPCRRLSLTVGSLAACRSPLVARRWAANSGRARRLPAPSVGCDRRYELNGWTDLNRSDLEHLERKYG